MKTLILLLLAAPAVVPNPASSQAATHGRVPTCHGERATIVGTDRGEHLQGTAGRDVIAARAGRDVVHGLGGDDIICGGRGSDVLVGGRGDDRLHGGPDLVRTVFDEVRHHGDGLLGGPGDDLLDPGIDNGVPPEVDVDRPDFVTWTYSSHGVEVDAAHGTVTGEGHDVVRPFVGGWTLSNHSDVFAGTEGDDRVFAMDGDDILGLGAGNDLVGAGSGDDRVSVGGCSPHGRVDLGPGSDRATVVVDVPSSDARCDDVSDVLEVRAGTGSGADVLMVSTAGDTVRRWDMATGSYFVDSILAGRLLGFHTAEIGGLGTIRVVGTDQTDRVRAVAGPDEAPGSPTIDLAAGEGDDVFEGGFGDDTFDGGGGSDTYARDLGGTNTCTSVESDPTGACSVLP